MAYCGELLAPRFHLPSGALLQLQRGCYSDDVQSTVLKCWQSNLTIWPILRWTVISFQGLGENEAETRHREPNRATPGLAAVAVAGADGKSAQMLVQVSARLLAETWRLDPIAVSVAWL